MSELYKITEYDDLLNLELKGSSPKEFEAGLTAAFKKWDEISSTGRKVNLQTFVAEGHHAELEFFLARGFIISNTMLTLERDLSYKAEVIEPATPVDVFQYDVDKLGLDTYLKANGQGFGKKDPEAMIREQLSMPESRIYVTCIKNKIVSSVTVWQAPDDINTYCTENIFTVPKYRGKHLASHLLTKILGELSDAGAKKARLTVYGDDYEAIDMYLKLGFFVTGARYELLF